MKEIKCAVIQDLLPLYVDEVVSEDTKMVVKEHLQMCEECTQEYEQMKKTLYVPIEKKATLFSQLNKRWNQKKWRLIFSSVLVTTLIGLTLFSFIFYYAKPIPYKEDLIKIEEMADGTLFSNYFGESHAGTYATHPIEIEMNGEIKNIVLLYYAKTIANSPKRNFLSVNKERSPMQITLPDSKIADAVYYGPFELEITDIREEKKMEELLQHMTLIWERKHQY